MTTVQVTAVVPNGATTGRSRSPPRRERRRARRHSRCSSHTRARSRSRSVVDRFARPVRCSRTTVRRMPAFRAGGHQAVRRRALALDHHDVHREAGPLPSVHPRRAGRYRPKPSNPARQRRDLQGRSVERCAPSPIRRRGPSRTARLAETPRHHLSNGLDRSREPGSGSHRLSQ